MPTAILSLSLSCALAALPQVAEPAQATAVDAVSADPVVLMPEAIASFGAVVCDSRLYVAGGHTGGTHVHSRQNLAAHVRRVPLDGGAWETLPATSPLQSVALVQHEGRVMRVGGLGALNDRGEPEELYSVADVAVLDETTGKWTALQPLPEPRSSHDAIVHDGTLYVLGGWRLAGEDREWYDHGWTLDLTDPSARWERIAQSFQRRAIAIAAIDDRLIVVGGLSPDGMTSMEVESLDLATGSWSELADLPGNGFGSAVVAVDDAFYATDWDGYLYRYDDAVARWSEVAQLAFPRIFHRLVRSGPGELLAVGGSNDAGHIRHIERIPLETDGPPITTLTIASEIASRQRQGIVVAHGDVYLAGGNAHADAHRFEPEDFVADSWRLRLTDASAEALPPLPEARQSMVAVRAAHSGASRALLLGGFAHDGEAEVSRDSILELDAETGAWALADVRLPRPLTQFGAAAHGGDVWVFGGLDYDPLREGESFAHSAAVYRWHAFGEGGFEHVGDMARVRRAFGGAALNGSFYVVSGMRDDFEIAEDCEAFDFESGTWRTIASPRRPRLSPTLVAVGRRLYLVGGSSRPEEGASLEPDASIEVYDPATDTWSVLTERIPVSPRHVRAQEWNERLLLISTSGAEGEIELAVVRP